MHGHLAHFAFNADASRSFYERLFGWDFEDPYPAFFRTSNAGGTIGAVQARRALPDTPTNGAEVTFSVDTSAPHWRRSRPAAAGC
jgi:predicted enzyme related to lactoylglutathione lyase